jgi:membrane-bound lytic murein transglycosylase A
LVLLCVASCSVSKTSVKKRIVLRRTSYDKLAGWNNDKIMDFVAPLSKSCAKIGTMQDKEYIDYSKIKIKTKDYLKICDSFEKVEKTEDSLRLFIRRNFAPYLVMMNGKKEGVFTGYYEAELNGSFEKTAKYNTPLYGLPEDLVLVNPKNLDKKCCDKTLVGRLDANKRISKYYDRKQINNGTAFKAPVLLWVDSPVDAFILHIQGSGRVNMPDGSVVRVGYAGNNGHEFVGIGGLMLKRRLNEQGGYSMPAIKKWLVKNPKPAKKLMEENPRFIFFKIIEGEGPIGAQGVPLTPMRSIAVDRNYISLGTPLWIETNSPDGDSINKIVMAQDMGAAINGAIRADYFWGFGEKAFNMAGRMKSSGKYYILLPIKK